MPAFTASSPGKIILFGEHAVVYGQPAIAVPVSQVRARAIVSADLDAPSGQVRIEAPEVNLISTLEALAPDHPLRLAVQKVLDELGATHCPACTLRITSTIPVASGLGSGAAVSISIMRAMAGYLGYPLSDDTVCRLAFEVEKVYHGNPSGIDNTVITYQKPIFFIRDHTVQILTVLEPFTILIADSGISCPTALTVGDVRCNWQADPPKYEKIFQEIGQVTRQARQHIEQGQPQHLGNLMNTNQDLLQALQVSSPELDRLVAAARQAGALGAKLSGGGRGGNMIALVEKEKAGAVAGALKAASAVNTIVSEVGSTSVTKTR